MSLRPVWRPIPRPAIRDVFAGGGGPGGPSLQEQVQDLFGASDEGVMFDFSSSSNLAQASNGTSPVTTYGQTIGYVTDLSGKSHPATQGTAANRPIWRGQPVTIGSELSTNGRFTVDADWTKGTGWTIGSGVATATAGSASLIEQSVTVEAGKTYFLVYDITRSAGTIVAQLTGGTTVSGISRNATGSYVEILTAVTGNTTLAFSKDASFAGTLFNVTLKEITEFAGVGAFFTGNPQTLDTAAINMSASDKATLVASFKQDSVSGSQNIAIFGNFASVAGSIHIDLATQPFLRIRGASAGATVNVPSAERGSGVASRQYVNVYSVDLAGAAILDQGEIQIRGVVPTQTAGGSLSGGGNLANSTLRMGTASLRGLIDRLFLINRSLSSDEVTLVQRWAMQGKCFAAALGDSTVSFNSSPTPNVQRISDFVPGLITNAADLSESGNRIADQLAYWTALAEKTALQAVMVQIGLNDVKGRVGANTATTAEVIADLQDLVDTINTDKPSGCKVFICGLTPCKVWLDAATNPTAAYQAWLDVNEAIAGGGSTPITGVDGRITDYIALLADASNNLLPIYDHNNDGVHFSNEAKFIVAQSWRATLASAGLL